jgi:hypothetical protein
MQPWARARGRADSPGRSTCAWPRRESSASTDSSIDRDRLKATVYARAKVREYWIANLLEGIVEVHRKPRETRGGEWSYLELKRVKPGSSLRPLAAPGARLKVSDFLR